MILIHPNRLTSYTDEIADEPTQAITMSRDNYHFPILCLRRAWTGNICNEISEAALERLKIALGTTKVLLLSSDLGLTTTSHHNGVDKETFDKPFLVANYFGARYIRIHIGTAAAKHLRADWMKRVGDRAIQANIIPLFEYNPECGKMTASEIVDLVNIHPRWKIIYDPAQFITRTALDPYKIYWPQLAPKVALIELHDYKIGVGFRPAGHGDCKLKETISDANTRGFNGQYIIETGLGKRYSTALNRNEVFKLAYNAIIDNL